MAIGLGYTAKITALFGLVILGGFWLFQRQAWPRWSILAVDLGAVMILALETLILSVQNDGFHFRPMSLLDTSETFVSNNVYDIGLERYIPGFFAGLLWPLNSGFVFNALFGLAVFAAIGFYYFKMGRDPAFHGIVWWGVGLVLCLNFACLGYSQPIVNTIQMRYLMFFTPAACLSIAVVLAQLSSSLRAGLVSALAFSALVCCGALYSTWKPHDAGYRHLYTTIDDASQPAASVYYHDRLSALYSIQQAGGRR